MQLNFTNNDHYTVHFRWRKYKLLTIQLNCFDYQSTFFVFYRKNVIRVKWWQNFWFEASVTHFRRTHLPIIYLPTIITELNVGMIKMNQNVNSIFQDFSLEMYVDLLQSFIPLKLHPYLTINWKLAFRSAFI